LGIVVEGESGYYTTNYPSVPTRAEAVAWAGSCNRSMGVGEREAIKIIASSIVARHKEGEG
jgi:hypothetical protein